MPLCERQITILSGGEKKPAIACALAMNPEIIILDEHTSNIDPEGVRSVVSLLGDLKGMGKTVILVSKKLDSVICLQNITFTYPGGPKALDSLSKLNKEY